MGVGLCKSGPLFRRISIDFVPEWYHTGGPCQIGSSRPVGPDCLCTAAVCFVQPRHPAADQAAFDLLQRTIEFLSCRSQCAPSALESRGPPSMGLSLV
jgi:hypothetical protein